MSLPVFCAACGDLIDTEHALAGFGKEYQQTRKVTCPGKGEHLLFLDAGKRCFGLMEKTQVLLLGGSATYYVYEYVGPKNLVLLFLALVYSWLMGTRVFVNKKIVQWGWRKGFTGDGFKNFQNLQKQAA